MVKRCLAAATAIGVLAAVPACGSRPPDPTTAPGCAEFAAYAGHAGTTVTMMSPVRDAEGDRLVRAWEQFEECTAITIDYRGSDQFEVELPAEVEAGRAPDLAVFPQPGMIDQMARRGALRPIEGAALTEARAGFSDNWLRYATVDGVLYAIPMDASVKSIVWYSPRMFMAKGYPIPATWQELITLSQRIAKDGIKPWCAGIESGAATGWPATDWLEETLLASGGPEVYDDWVSHRIPSDDPRVVAALDQVGAILRNPDFVNGGYGGVASIASTAFQEGGLPILEGRCAMHRQATFYGNWWPPNARVGPQGDVYAFPEPPMTAQPAEGPAPAQPVLAGGTYAGAFSDRPEVMAVTAYLATADFANTRASVGQTVSAHRGLNPDNLDQPVAQLAVSLLRDDETVLRFDGSDLMPTAVNEAFWRAMTEWIGGRSSASALAEVERAWP